KDLAGALVRCPEVHGDVVAGNSERLRFLGEGVRQLDLTDQSLRGATAHVEADAAPALLLDNCGLEAQLRRENGGDVLPGAVTDYYYVIMFSHGPNLIAKSSPEPALV